MSFWDMVIVGIVGYGIYTVVKKNMQKQKIEQSAKDSMAEAMKAEGFEPDYRHFNKGTGVAIKKGDPRLCLVSKGQARFFQIADVVGIRAHEATEKETILAIGFLPAHAKDKTVQIFVVEVTVKDVDTPLYTIVFDSDAEMRNWESRLNAFIAQS